MLDPEYKRRVAEGSENIASLLHEEIIKVVVEGIVTRMERGVDYRLTARDKWLLETLQAAGYLREDLEREIAAKTKLMLTEIRAAFDDAAVRNMAWDDAVYAAAGLEPPPLRQSPYLLRLVERGYKKTAGEWVNFTGTLADAAQQLFIRECDKAYHLTASGAMSQAQAVRQAVDTVGREGVVVKYTRRREDGTRYVYHTDTIETATARAVRTGVGQACGEMTLARMEEMGWDIVLVSAHLGARTGDGGENFTNHYWWQGKFYRRDVTVETIRQAMNSPGRSQQADVMPGSGELPPAASGTSGGERSGPKPAQATQYEDITDNWYPDATPGSHKVQDASEVTVNGVTYRVDGHNVQLSYSPHEKEIAELLEREVGGELYMLPRVNDPQGVKTPDYLFNGKEYDLKTLTSKNKNAVFRRVKSSAGQTRNFIIDVSETGLSDQEVDEQISKIYWSDDTKFVNEMVIIRGRKIVKVVKRR